MPTSFQNRVRTDVDENNMKPNDRSYNGKRRTKIRASAARNDISDVDLLIDYLECYGQLSFDTLGKSSTEEAMRPTIVLLASPRQTLPIAMPPAGTDYKLNLFMAVLTSHIEHAYHTHRSLLARVVNALARLPVAQGAVQVMEWVGYLTHQTQVSAAAKLLDEWLKTSKKKEFSKYCSTVGSTEAMQTTLEQLDTEMHDNALSGFNNLKRHIASLQSPFAVYQFARFMAIGMVSNMDRHHCSSKDKLTDFLSTELKRTFKEYDSRVNPTCYARNKKLIWAVSIAATAVAGAAMKYLPELLQNNSDSSYTP